MKKIISILLLLLSSTLMGEEEDRDVKKEEIVFEEVERDAKTGDSQSQFDLAIMYYGGNRVDPDSKAGYEWLKRAAENGNPHALFLMGYMKEWGISTKQDPYAAADYYEKSVYEGNTALSYKLATLYYYTLKDPVKAYAWISIASRSGFESTDSFRRSLYRNLSSGEKRKAEDLSKEISRRVFKN